MLLKTFLILVSLAGPALTAALSGSRLSRFRAVGYDSHGEPPIHCDPLYMEFGSSTSVPDFERDFDPLSPPSSYSLDADGLKLYLEKPAGEVTTKGNVNSEVAEGATFNSTFTVRYVLYIDRYGASLEAFADTPRLPTPSLLQPCQAWFLRPSSSVCFPIVTPHTHADPPSLVSAGRRRDRHRTLGRRSLTLADQRLRSCTSRGSAPI